MKGDMIINIMRVKHLKTESNLYGDHLEQEKKYPFYFSERKEPQEVKDIQVDSWQTNFSITLSNPYAFVLLHLRKTIKTKNYLGINIPEICIFHGLVPYQMLHSESGVVIGHRGKQSLRLREVYNFFRTHWKARGTPKEQPCIACFQNEQFLMMSQTDLFISCRKFKNDPFFTKLYYLRNKLVLLDNPIEVDYDAKRDYRLAGLATQALMGLKIQQDHLPHSEQEELKLNCAKISLFLNYQHNIRVSKGLFYFSKAPSGEYYFVNVKNLRFSNLTTALKQREIRMKQRQEQRNQILIMSEEKEERYRKHENSPLVKVISDEMDDQWVRMADSMRIKTNQQRKAEEMKNEGAFMKLYPDCPIRFEQLLARPNFQRTKQKLLHFDTRRPLFKKTGYAIRLQRPRMSTEPDTEPVREQSI